MAKTQQWQTVQEAADEIGCSSQRIRQLVGMGKLSHTVKYGLKLVEKPVSYRIDRARQKRAVLSRA